MSFFTPVAFDDLHWGPREKCPQFSILADFCSVVVWMVSIRPQISSYLRVFFFQIFWLIPSAPTIFGINVTLKVIFFAICSFPLCVLVLSWLNSFIYLVASIFLYHSIMIIAHFSIPNSISKYWLKVLNFELNFPISFRSWQLLSLFYS